MDLAASVHGEETGIAAAVHHNGISACLYYSSVCVGHIGTAAALDDTVIRDSNGAVVEVVVAVTDTVGAVAAAGDDHITVVHAEANVGGSVGGHGTPVLCGDLTAIVGDLTELLNVGGTNSAVDAQHPGGLTHGLDIIGTVVVRCGKLRIVDGNFAVAADLEGGTNGAYIVDPGTVDGYIGVAPDGNRGTVADGIGGTVAVHGNVCIVYDIGPISIHVDTAEIVALRAKHQSVCGSICHSAGNMCGGDRFGGTVFSVMDGYGGVHFEPLHAAVVFTACLDGVGDTEHHIAGEFAGGNVPMDTVHGQGQLFALGCSNGGPFLQHQTVKDGGFRQRPLDACVDDFFHNTLLISHKKYRTIIPRAF